MRLPGRHGAALLLEAASNESSLMVKCVCSAAAGAASSAGAAAAPPPPPPPPPAGIIMALVIPSRSCEGTRGASSQDACWHGSQGRLAYRSMQERQGTRAHFESVGELGGLEQTE